MKKQILAMIALTSLLSACHERRQEPPIDDAAIRAHAAESQGELQRQSPTPEQAH